MDGTSGFHAGKKGSMKLFKEKQRKQAYAEQQRRDGEAILHPPTLPDYAITHRKKLRFLVNATLTQQVITYSNLVDTVCIVATSTSLYNLFRAVRVLSVEMWDSALSNAISSIGILFGENDSNQGGTQCMTTDTSLGIQPAHLFKKPAKGSLSSQWHVGFGPNTTQAFVLWCSASCIIDVHLEFRSSSIGSANGAALACVGGVVGAVAYRGLDGLAIATTKFLPPVSVYSL